MSEARVKDYRDAHRDCLAGGTSIARTAPLAPPSTCSSTLGAFSEPRQQSHGEVEAAYASPSVTVQLHPELDFGCTEDLQASIKGSRVGSLRQVDRYSPPPSVYFQPDLDFGCTEDLQANFREAPAQCVVLGPEEGIGMQATTPVRPPGTWQSFSIPEQDSAHAAPAGANDEYTSFPFYVPRSKLETRGKVIVSDMFAILVGDQKLSFRVQLVAKQLSTKRNGHSWRTAQGRGHLELKCESLPPEDMTPLCFCFRVGQERRGPLTHDFISSPVGCLPHGQEEWNFRDLVDEGSGVCEVRVEIVSGFGLAT